MCSWALYRKGGDAAVRCLVMGESRWSEAWDIKELRHCAAGKRAWDMVAGESGVGRRELIGKIITFITWQHGAANLV